jgi:hypothetical protein
VTWQYPQQAWEILLAHKLLKKATEHSGQQALPSNHRVVLSWCTPTLVFNEPPVDNVAVKASIFNFQYIILSETFCCKNAESAENGQIFFLSVFQRSVTHSRVARVAHQAVAIKAGQSAVCVRAFSAFYLLYFKQ